MESVLTSIRPKWVVKIASGEKTFDVRKTAPKLKPPFKCYIYCTKDENYKIAPFRFIDGWYIKHYDNLSHYANGCTANVGETLNGKVIGEFICDEIKEYPAATIACAYFETNGAYVPEEGRFQQGTCLSYQEMYDYSNGKTLYGWHISELKIYDKPKEISEFCKPCLFNYDCMFCKYHSCGNMFDPPSCDYEFEEIARPPQSWCYVEEV